MKASWICCFTGHRSLSVEEMEQLNPLLERVLRYLINKGVTVFRTGGAVGFDTLVALKILEQKAWHPEISLELILPCRDQTKYWDHRSASYYRAIMEHADRIEFLSEQYYEGCMRDRNHRLVEDCHFCIGYSRYERSGSQSTLNYAKKQGIRTCNLRAMMDGGIFPPDPDRLSQEL